MSLRRVFSVIGLAALAAAFVCACLPWSVATPRLAGLVGRELARTYGIAMTAEGRAEVALLPLPRLGFDRVRLSAVTAPGSVTGPSSVTGPGSVTGQSPVTTEGFITTQGPVTTEGPVLAEGGHLSLQLNLLALLAGRIDVTMLSLEGAAITLPASDGDGRWAEPMRRLTARLSTDGVSHPRRVTVTRATVTGRDPRDGSRQTARDVDLTLSWPLWSSQVDVSGSFVWSETPARFVLAGLRIGDLLAGRASPFVGNASWPAGSLSATGTGSVRDGVSLTGQGSLTTRSLAETLAWTGGGLALSPFIGTFGLEGSFEMTGRTLLLPSVRVSVGDNRLEGAGAVTFGESRPAVQATLAAETLNVAPLLADFLRVFGLDDPGEGARGWSTQSVALHPFTRGDLDLRLSAGSARLGPVVLEDLAASVLVRDGSIEAALSRATVQGATLKGRVGLNAAAADRGETEMRAQASFDRLDLAALMRDFGQDGWVLGGAQGQFALDGAGRTAGAFVRRLNGRATLAIDGGTIAGIDLADVIHRNGVVAAGALARRNGRTAFERAGVTLRFVDGIGEIVDGSLKAAALTASLRGTISLPERTVMAQAELMPRTGPATLFDIAGPWDAVSVRAAARTDAPDALPKALRSPVTGGTAGLPAGLPAAIRAYAPTPPEGPAPPGWRPGGR